MVTLNYIPSLRPVIKGTDAVIGILMTIPALIIAILPTYFLLKKDREKNILDNANDISPLLGKVLAFLYAAAFIYLILIVIGRYDLFVTSVMLPEAPSGVITAIIVVAACYMVWMGIEAICRSSTLYAVLFTLTAVFVYSTLIKRFDILNFEPLFYRGYKPSFTAMLDATSRTDELLMLGLLVPRIKGNIKKSFLTFVLIGMGVIASIFLMMYGILGQYSETQLFPVFTFTTMAGVSVFKRLEPILTCTWLLGITTKTAVLLYLIISCLKVSFNLKSRKIPIILIGILLIPITIIMNKSFKGVTEYQGIQVFYISFAFFAIIVPLFLIIAKKIKARGKKA